MTRFIIRRLIAMVPTILIVTMAVFALLLITPGQDPANLLLGEEADAERLAYFREKLGLDRPIPVQYADWLWGVVRGDLGRSFRTHERITTELGRRFQVTVELAAGSLLVALLISLPIGIYSAARPNSVGDNVGTVFAIAGAAIPSFWLGIMLIYGFAVILDWLPAQGYVKPFDDPVENLRRMILPMTMNGATSSATLTRQTRSAMLEVLRQDYIRTAHAKGLTEGAVLVRHALKNAMIPVVTLLGIAISLLLGGSAITEIIFRLPGMGQFAVSGALNFDLPVVQGVLLFFGAIVLVVNFLVDITYGFLDPRVRYS